LDYRSARRQVGRYGALCVLACTLSGGIPAVAATDEVEADVPAVAEAIAPSESGPVAPAADGRRTLGRLPANLGRGFVGVFHADNLGPFLVGGMAAGSASFLDAHVRNSVANPDSGFGKSLETAGGWPSSVLVVGLFTAGRLSHEPGFRAMSYDLLDATIINFGYTELLKVTVRRERPDRSNNQSFPSGHSSNAFALATVAERHYGWKVGVPAYALAAAIGYARVVRDKHYLSDSVAGAALGYIVGRTVVRVNGRALGGVVGRQATWNLSPIVARNARGLELTLAF
jgi:membrane-associated phospholipid phosphatase